MDKEKEEKRYNFVYQTKNMITNKTYVGLHSTNNLKDGYIGCGVSSKNQSRIKTGNSPFKKSIDKYGYDNFKVEILSFFNNREEAVEEEKFIVNEDWIKRTDNYNIALGGGNPMILKGKDHYMYNKKFDEHILERRKEEWEKIDWSKSKKYVGDIYVYSFKTNKLVGIYKLISDIHKELNVTISSISNCLKSKSLQSKEYFFTRDNTTDFLLQHKTILKHKKDNNKRNVAVIAIDPKTNRRFKFVSYGDAIEKLGITVKTARSNMKRAIDNGKTCAGYLWEKQ